MQTVEEFCDAWSAAELDGQVDVLDGLLINDFIGVGPLGFTLAKPAWLGRHGSGDMRYTSFELNEVAARVYPGAAVVTARQDAEAAFQGHPTPGALRTTLVLVAAGDRWQLAAAHMSFIAGTPGAPALPGAATSEVGR